MFWPHAAWFFTTFNRNAFVRCCPPLSDPPPPPCPEDGIEINHIFVYRCESRADPKRLVAIVFGFKTNNDFLSQRSFSVINRSGAEGLCISGSHLVRSINKTRSRMTRWVFVKRLPDHNRPSVIEPKRCRRRDRSRNVKGS